MRLNMNSMPGDVWDKQIGWINQNRLVEELRAKLHEEASMLDVMSQMLQQQTCYCHNAVSEVMRLRHIIAACDGCREKANAGADFGDC